jgi:hypothetical protein
MDLHSGTKICCKANIWYIPHNMYLVSQSTTSNYNAAEDINLIAEFTS